MLSIKGQVDELFRPLPRTRGSHCDNPVTGGSFVRGYDSLARQKRIACRALVARAWAAESASPDVPPLPLDVREIHSMSSFNPYLYLWGYFARSIICRDYNVAGHPPFEIYACGLMASPLAPDFLTQDEELRRRFPPRTMPGLMPGLIWRSPAERAEEMKFRQRAEERRARLARKRSAQT